MMKLTHPNGESVVLSHDFLWTDEFAWSDLAQTAPERTLSGSQIIQQGVKKAGRPITLEPADSNMAWTRRDVVETLQRWAMLPETKFTLTLPQGTFSVIFDNSQTAVSAKLVIGFGSLNADDDFLLTLKFLTV